MENLFSLRKINSALIITNIIGLFLAAYAFHVETTVEADVSYEPLCDINEFISCTKAFSSDYGKGFGVVKYLLGEDSVFYLPNSIYGLFIYLLIGILSTFNSLITVKFVLILAIISNFGSIYLAIILYLLQDICIVCVATYVVNFINFVLALSKLKTIRSQVDAKED